MVVIRGKGASHDRASRGEVNGKLARDGGMLDVRNPFGREQGRDDMAVLSDFARGERITRPDWQAEVEADTVEVARAGTGAGSSVAQLHPSANHTALRSIAFSCITISPGLDCSSATLAQIGWGSGRACRRGLNTVLVL